MECKVNQNEARGGGLLIRMGLGILLAVAMGLGISLFIGAAAWSKQPKSAQAKKSPPRSSQKSQKASVPKPAPRARQIPYTEAELRSVETTEEAKLRVLRTQEITQLRIALGMRSPRNRRAELYFRLAEIYLESYRATFLLEGKAHERRLERGIGDLTIERSASRPYLGLGIKACKEILRLGMGFGGMDKVYYFLGFNYAETGDKKQSGFYFNELMKRYPSSPLAAEAYREMGDQAFREGDFRRAIVYYESASGRMRSDAKARTQHKLAWCYYRVKQFGRAVATMKEAAASAATSGEKLVSLKEEALRDMALFMTETGRVEEAISYFQEVARDKSYYPRVLERLGRQFERNMEPAKAARVYESLLRTHPESDAAFRFQVKLVDLDLRLNHPGDALKRLKGMVFRRGGDSDTQAAAQNLRAMIRRTATEHHENFRKKGDGKDLDVAAAFYTAYIEVFLSSEDAGGDPRNEVAEARMYLAEVKREQGKHEEASSLYRKIVDSKDKRYAKEAGALWTASLADAISKSSRGSPTHDSEPSSVEKEFVEAADHMKEALDDTPEARDASLRAAQILSGYKTSQKAAIKRIGKIIDSWPKSAQAVTAARLWIQILSDRLPQVGAGSAAQPLGDEDAEDDLKDALSELRKNGILLQTDHESGGKLKALLAEQESRLKILNIARKESEGDYTGAAKAYETYAAETSSRDFAEKAYSGAIANFLKARKAEAVERVSAAWFKRFSKSPKAVESVRVTATHFFIMEEFDVSGRLFERVGTDGGDAKALETAARIFDGGGDVTRAKQSFAIYLEMYPSSQRKSNVALALARLYETLGQSGEAQKAYAHCLQAPIEFSVEFEVECATRSAWLHFESKDPGKAWSLVRKVASHKSNEAPQAAAYVGYARYRLAEVVEQEGKFDQLSGSDAQLKKALSQRLSFFDSMNKAYGAAVEAGGPWAISALDRLARWTATFADEMGRVPSANKKGGDAGALRRKAMATWSDAYSKVLSMEILSPAVGAIIKELSPGFQAPEVKRAFYLSGAFSDGSRDGRLVDKMRDKLSRNQLDPGAWVDYGNLLVNKGKPGLGKIAYEYALGLSAGNAQALNNVGVVSLDTEASKQDDWVDAAIALGLFKDASARDKTLPQPKINMAMLFQSYGLYAKCLGILSAINTASLSESGQKTSDTLRRSCEAWKGSR